MSSREYEQLQSRLAELKSEFVTFEIPIDRAPTSAELDKIAAFKLLMHAEIETFIEDMLLRTLSERVNRWIASKTLSRCILSLVIRWSSPSNEEERFRNAHDGSRLDELVRRCEKHAREEIFNNNSIKQDAFLRMCCSVGLIAEDLDSALLAELDSYGKTRGEVAHKAVGKVRSLNGPSEEARSAENIVTLLGHFDHQLALLTPASPP